jgi:hypothetical protein
MEVYELPVNEKIELFFGCRNLKKNESAKYDPQIIIYSRSKPSNPWAELGRTECIKQNQNPVFNKSLTMDYIFETQQFLKFKILNMDGPIIFDTFGEAEITVATLIGSKNQVKILDILDKTEARSGQLVLRAERVGRCKQNVIMKIRCRDIPDVHRITKTSPFYMLHRCNDNKTWTKAYESISFKGDIYYKINKRLINYQKGNLMT